MRVLLSVPKFLISKHQILSLHKTWHFRAEQVVQLSALLLFIKTAKTSGENISGDLFFVSRNKYGERFGGILNSHRKHLLDSHPLSPFDTQSHAYNCTAVPCRALWKPTSASLRHTLLLFTSEAEVPGHLRRIRQPFSVVRQHAVVCCLLLRLKTTTVSQVQRLQRRGSQERTSAYVAMAANQTWPIQTSGEWMTTPRSNREPVLEVKQLHHKCKRRLEE